MGRVRVRASILCFFLSHLPDFFFEIVPFLKDWPNDRHGAANLHWLLALRAVKEGERDVICGPQRLNHISNAFCVEHVIWAYLDAGAISKTQEADSTVVFSGR